VCVSIESHGSIFTTTSAIIEYRYIHHEYAPDTAQNHDANTACRATSTCTHPCKLQVYKICYSATTVVLPPRVQVPRYCYCSHARTPRGTKVSCCFAPTGQFLCLCLLSPRCLTLVVVVVVTRNLTKLVRLCFWPAICVYRTIRVHVYRSYHT
jgi:hypothetical protein